MKTKKPSYLKKSFGEKIFDFFNILLFLLLTIMFVYPFINVLVVSLNEPYDAMRGGLYLWPRKFSFENYKMVLSDPSIYNAYMITIARTLIGTITHVFCTAIFAYGLSKNELMFRKFYLIICTIPMFFGGGLIPSFLLIRSLGLVNSFWVYIIPGLISVWHMLIMKSFYKGIPDSLEEAAKIDGCSDFKIFFRIVAPLSFSCFAAIALFKGVEHWNSWFDAYIYVNDEKLLPMQTILMRIINQSASNQMPLARGTAEAASQSTGGESKEVTPESIRYATMIISIGPIILIYPFLQKYFVKGVLIGSVKG
mgnify:CR=1 FL=1